MAWVIDPCGPNAGAVSERRVEEVGLDTRGDDWPVPFEQCRDGEPDGLAATSWSDDGEARLRFGGEQLPTVKPEREAARRWVMHGEHLDVAAAGKSALSCPERTARSRAASSFPFG